MARRNPLLGNRSLGTTGHPASTTTPAPSSTSLRSSRTGAGNFSQRSKGRAGRKARGGWKNAGSANRSGGQALLRVMGAMVGTARNAGTARGARGRLPGVPATKSATNVRGGANRAVR